MGEVFLLGRDYFYLQRPYFVCRNSMILEVLSSQLRHYYAFRRLPLDRCVYVLEFGLL